MAPVLHPDIEACLALFPTPDVDHGDVVAIREQAARYMAEHGGPAPQLADPRVLLEPATVAGVDVLVWSPVGLDRPAPWVVAAHGGGFVAGAALGAERVAVPLAAQHGIVTVSVAYRLAPEHRAPAALDDCWEVLTACRDAGAVRGLPLDPARLAVHGSSAGGCLAGGLALRARDAGISIALQSLSCPALDDSQAPDAWSPTWSAEASDWMWRHYLGEQCADPYAVPARATDLAGVAPAHLVVAEHDVLRRDALNYAARLRGAGIDVVLTDMPGTVHAFDGLMSDTAPAREAIVRQVTLLADRLTVGSA